MTTKPVITLDGSMRTPATPDDVYAVLADLNTHLGWAGADSPNPAFHLLTMEAPAGSATVGTRFSSKGANSKDGSATFHDSSVVVVAEPGRAFGFDTESRLSRKRRPEWEVRFEHRYTITREADGTRIDYTAQVYPKNYRPYWLQPMMRPMTKVMVRRMHNKHMRALARLAEGRRQAVGG